MNIIEMLLDIKKYMSRKRIAAEIGVNIESISNWIFGVSNPNISNEEEIEKIYKNIEKYKKEFYEERERNYKIYQNKRSKL
jgi:transcriptional regulator with XRE-family HTH domain